jgi:hypothetical protein
MYARAGTIALPPERLEEGVGTLREQVIPLLQEQPGFAGGYVLVDRQRATALAISLWDSQEALDRSGEAMADRLLPLLQQVGADAPAGRYEVAFTAGEPSGRYARVTSGEGMTGSHEAGERYVHEQALPALQAAPGFRGLLHLVDRPGGRVLGVAFFDTEAALRQTAALAGQLRAGADQVGISGTRTAADYEVAVQAQPVAR